MVEPDRPAGGSDVQALEAEIARLNKVVEALMDRSEAAANIQGSDFGLFQTTVMLQDQVRLRSAELEAAARDTSDDASTMRASAPRDMQTLRRTAAFQIQLLELVVQQKDVGELVERVAAILDVPIILFDARGRVVCSSRSAADAPDLAAQIWTAYKRDMRGSRDPDGVGIGGGQRAFYREIAVRNHAERVLAAVASRPQPAAFAGASLLFLQQLVTLDLLRGRDELRMRRRVRRGLLRDVLSGKAAPDELLVRLQAQGFDTQNVLRIVIVEPGTTQPSPAESAEPRTVGRLGGRLLRSLDDALSRRRMPFLSSPMGAQVVVITELPDAGTAAARALLADLQQAATQSVSSDPVAVGCSAPLPGVAGAARGLLQAKAACSATRRAPQVASTGIFEELSGQFRLLDGLDETSLRDLVHRTFAPLLDYDARHRAMLFETLRTLFEHRLAVQETADALHIHRNTLQKRLAHVERLLSIDLSDLDAIVDVRLGLHAAELLGEPPQ
jgi:DNA-binding PucR family transcriptional regulator